ncbi:hypothetical protein IJ531_00450, partial [bacterium]|nr:hypothetical protein [bacterium]
MPENTVSPLLQARLNNTSKAQETKTEEIKQQEEPKKVNKALIGAGAAAGVAALALGGILIFRGKQAPEAAVGAFDNFKKLEEQILERFDGAKERIQALITESKAAQEEAQAVQEKAQQVFEDPSISETYQKVMGFFDLGKEKGFEEVKDEAGNVIRKFDIKPASEKRAEQVIMSEFQGDKLIRKSELRTNGSIFLTIDEFQEAAQKRMRFQDAVCNEVSFIDNSTDNPIILESFTRNNNGLLSRYIKNAEDLAPDKRFVEKELYFSSDTGRLISYKEDILHTPELYEARIGKEFDFYSSDGLTYAYINFDRQNNTLTEKLDISGTGEFKIPLYQKGCVAPQGDDPRHILINSVSNKNATSVEEQFQFAISESGELMPNRLTQGYKLEDETVSRAATYTISQTKEGQSELINASKNVSIPIAQRDEKGRITEWGEVSS